MEAEKRFHALKKLTITQNESRAFMTTLSSQRSATRFQMTRLLHYFMFADEHGKLTKFDVWRAEDISDLFPERFFAAQAYGVTKLGAASEEKMLDVAPDETQDAFTVDGKPHQWSDADFVQDEGQQLLKLFPGLSLSQLGRLCYEAATYTRAEIVREKIESLNNVPLGLILQYHSLQHGPGYAVPSAGFGILNQYVARPGTPATENEHLRVAQLLTYHASFLESALLFHPMVFITFLADTERMIREIQGELRISKDYWQVSKGHDRLKMSRTIDATLKVMYLRIRKNAAKNARVGWQDIAEDANLEQHTRTESPEQYARKLWSERNSLFWPISFLDDTMGVHGESGFALFASLDQGEFLKHALRIERFTAE